MNKFRFFDNRTFHFARRMVARLTSLFLGVGIQGVTASDPIFLESEMKSLNGEEFHDIPDDEQETPYTARWWSYLSGTNPPTYSYTDFGLPNAQSINSSIEQAPWLPRSSEPNNLVTGFLKEAFLGTSAEATAAYWSDYWEPWTQHTWRVSRTDHRMRLAISSPALVPYVERYLMITREGDMSPWGSIPWFDDTEVTDIEVVEMRIQPTQNRSSWHTIQAEAAAEKHRLVSMQRLDITVVCGIGPGGLVEGQGMYSKELLEAYLESVKLERDGDVWSVNGKNANGQDRVYGVQIVTDEAGLFEALQAEGRTVIYDGHANFGLGPNFSVATHKEVADFTNFGVNCTAIPQTFRGDGNENDIVSAFGPNGQPLVDPAPGDVAALDRMNEEGWSYLTLQPGEIKGNVPTTLCRSSEASASPMHLGWVPDRTLPRMA